MIRGHDSGSGVELVRIEGAALPLRVLILPALFDEANRMRRLTVQLMHRLAEAGIGSILPDLPGTGESAVGLARIGWGDWTRAVWRMGALLPAFPRLTVGLRGGALLDHFLEPGAPAQAWRFAPETGARVLRDLDRAQRIGGGDAGYPIAPGLRAALAAAEPADGAHVRTVRLADDPAPADARVAGERLWRRAEPGEDAALVEQLALDIAQWVGRCARP